MQVIHCRQQLFQNTAMIKCPHNIKIDYEISNGGDTSNKSDIILYNDLMSDQQ